MAIIYQVSGIEAVTVQVFDNRITQHLSFRDTLLFVDDQDAANRRLEELKREHTFLTTHIHLFPLPDNLVKGERESDIWTFPMSPIPPKSQR